MKLFAGNISNLTDARYFAAWNVDWMGFNLDPSSGQALNAERLRAILEWVEGPQPVLEPGLSSDRELQTAKELFSCNYFKLHPLQQPDSISIGTIHICPTLVVMPDSKASDIEAEMEAWKSRAIAFVLDFHKNGIHPASTGIEVRQLREWTRQKNIFIAWPLAHTFDPDFVTEAGFYGIYLSGGEEEKVGVKSYDALDDILEAIKEPFS